MSNTNRIIQALELATRAHAGQTDKAGMDYIHHPMIVASFVETEDEKILALLHDTVEDTDVTNDEVREIFGDTIADALECMTHRDEESYDDYLQRVATNPLAIRVKLADLRHNSDISRISNPTEKDLKRLEKYANAKNFLESFLINQ